MLQDSTVFGQEVKALELGGGRVEHYPERVRLLRPATSTTIYSDAQIQNYAAEMPNQAPLTLTLRAAFSHPADELRGTAGFGFWNHPFSPASARLAFPKAAWFFFGSPPHNLPSALDVIGHGFKAATLDATHWPFFALLPTAPIGFLLMRVPALYRRLWPIAQRAIKVSEAVIPADITQIHTYRLTWEAERLTFWIDDTLIHTSPFSPTGRMGFIAWIDNQYAIVTPQGRFGWGLLEDAKAQWLDLYDLRIERG